MQKKKRINRILAAALCICLTLGSVTVSRGAGTADAAVKQESQVISIRTTEEFLEFAQNCTSDSWSRNKIFRLDADLDVSGSTLRSVPVFGGIFDGNGHKITGYVFQESASPQGLFRYVQESGLIKNLTVEGTVLPEGSRKTIGGIAGENAGTLQNCRFFGTVGGDGEIGGIAGINTITGLISNCKSYGVVYGKQYVGGITGRNYGTVLLSENRCSVNTTVQSESKTIAAVDISSLTLEELNQEVNLSDIGGIAGWSGGILQDCTNEGTVGYAHTGYNVGGIVGRQCGYVNQCTNQGAVYGRKDVGGIAGQMEPYSQVLSTSRLSQLRKELSRLQTMLTRLLDDADSSASGIALQMDAISGSLGKAQDTADSLIQQTTAIVNQDIDAVTAVSTRFSEVLTRLEPVMDRSTDVIPVMKTAVGQLQQSVASVQAMSPKLKKAFEEMDQALADLAGGLSLVQQGCREISEGITHLKQSLGDAETVEVVLDEISDGIGDLSSGLRQVSDAAENMQTAAEDLRNSELWEDTLGSLDETSAPAQVLIALQKFLTSDEFNDTLETVQTELSQMMKGLKQMTRGVREVQSGMEKIAEGLDAEELRKGFSSLESGAKTMEKAMASFASSIDHLRKASSWMETVSEDAEQAIQSIYESLGTLRTASALAEEVAGDLHQILADLAQQPAIQFTGADSTYIQTQEDLSDAIGSLRENCDALGDVLLQDSKALIAGLQDVSDQMMKIFNLLLDLAENQGSGTSAGSSISAETSSTSTGSRKDDEDGGLLPDMQDVSAEDTAGQTEGKVAACTNLGPVDGDINVGGIAGSMAREVDFDPEDDLLAQTGGLTEETTFYSRGVIRSCENRADVAAKKNYSGGIVGRMDFGYAAECSAARYITSRSGDFVGGIAGMTAGTIENCSAKTVLSGRDCVGGVAGSCSGSLKNCKTAVRIEDSREHRGGIAGLLEEDGTAAGNLYLEQTGEDGNRMGGIDQISYRGRAEAVTYEEMKKAGLPEILRSFTVRFLADGVPLKEVTVSYGNGISQEEIPTVPEKEGYFGSWDESCLRSVTSDRDLGADYVRCVSALASSQTREGGSSVLLVEGSFPQESRLQLQKVEDDGPAGCVEQWKATLLAVSDDREESGKHAWRYRLPKETRRGVKIQIQILEDGKWKTVRTKEEGRCLVFQASGTEIQFAAVEKCGGFMLWIGVLVLVLLLVSAAVVLRRKSRTERVGTEL